jgi:hypothetical protein
MSEQKSILTKIIEMPVLKWVILLLLGLHLYFFVEEFIDFNLGFSTIYHARVWVVLAYVLLWCWCIIENRFAYYVYIFFAGASMIGSLLVKDKTTYTIVMQAIFPFNLVFAGVLILDLQRVIFNAHKGKKV